MKKNSFKKYYKTNAKILIAALIIISLYILVLPLFLDNITTKTMPTGMATVSQVNITKGPISICDFDLEQDLNLISFHCLNGMVDRGFLLASIQNDYQTIYKYNANSPNDRWQSHNPSLPAWVVQDLTWMDGISGYWIDMSTASNFYYNGTISLVSLISLEQGWNLIGYPRNASIDATLAFSSVDGNYTIILAYNATTDTWESNGPQGNGLLINITKDRGYWIYINTTNEEWNITW